MKKAYIWGTGKVAERDLPLLPKDLEILGFIDNDANKQGQIFHGKKVNSPEVLLEKISVDILYILCVDYYAIEKQIAGFGIDCLNIINHIELEREPSKRQLISRYAKTEDSEIKEVLDYLNNHTLDCFNYPFVDSYSQIRLEIEYDSCAGMYYAMHFGKKMYFSKQYTSLEKAERYYRGILLEQDIKSPHKYIIDGYGVNEGDVVVDVGVAEGNFALEVIDKVSHIYLVEADSDWVEALKLTFAPYMNKVTIISAFVNSFDYENNSMLDSIIDKKINYLKMDIEGFEIDGLIGAKRLIDEATEFCCAICSYHGENDETLITSKLQEYGLRCTTSVGYMWYPGYIKNYVSNKLVRGLVRGLK